MNTETVSGDQKRDWKRKLLPLVALIIGLGAPVYAFAASEAECNACHDWCTFAYMTNVGACGGNPYCINEAGQQYAACHYACEQPGGPCVD